MVSPIILWVLVPNVWPTNNPSIFNQYVLTPQYHCPIKRSTIILYTMPFYENSQSQWNRLEILGSTCYVSMEFCAHSFHKGIVVNGIIVNVSLSDASMRKCVYVCLCVFVYAYACAYTYAYFITQDPYQFLSWYAGSRVQTNNSVLVAWCLAIQCRYELRNILILYLHVKITSQLPHCGQWQIPSTHWELITSCIWKCWQVSASDNTGEKESQDELNQL